MATSAKRAEEILNDRSQAEEDLLDELENEEIPAKIREARMTQFKNMAKELNELKQRSHGTYLEILEEKKFLDLTISEERCVVHFFHTDFRRCSIMDQHFKKLSKKHFETLFMKINVEKAQFFVVKLKIQVLPTILCFKKGVVVGRLIGFEELGNIDNFPTEVLEKRLEKTGVIFPAKETKIPRSILSVQKKKQDDSDNEE